ncbi:MAG: hypothetical protein Q9208_004116 [Pyrenodesmia sp. 3 TL-2023]
MAVTVPQKDPPPKPPIPNAILDKFDRCYTTESPPSEPDYLEKGGRLIKVDPNNKRLRDLIYAGCQQAKDPRGFSQYDDTKKGPDKIPIRLTVRARRWDPADPGRKDPEAPPSDTYICIHILYKILEDCPEYGGTRNIRNVQYDMFVNQRPLGKDAKSDKD